MSNRWPAALCCLALAVTALWRGDVQVKADEAAVERGNPWRIVVATHFSDTVGNRANRLNPQTGHYCASRDVPHGGLVEVMSLDCAVVCTLPVLDYGPHKRTGAGLDLSPKAFARFAPLRRGRVAVMVRQLEQEER